MLLVFSGMFAMFFFCTLYLQKVLGYSALETGVAFLPVSAGIVIGSVLAQQLIRRVGVKPVLVTGTTLAAIGLSVLAATTQVGGSYGELLAGLRADRDRDGPDLRPPDPGRDDERRPADAGLASGVFNTSQQIGGALGLAVLSTFANDRDRERARRHRRRQLPTSSDALVDGFQTRVRDRRRAGRRRRGARGAAAAPARRRPDRRGRRRIRPPRPP